MLVSREDFEEAVADALDSIPDELAQRVSNVAFLLEDSPPRGMDGLLGLYEGVPLTHRGMNDPGMLPDRITLYRNPLMAVSRTREELVRQIRITVLHEVGHYFGIGEDRLHDLGWG